ncbi:hypothetical protein [Novosphingobium sp.]|uniref:hypothetical protein n=1 Tax=Novosphingobium sp. TaxID=1874826 RepID=UPI0035B3ED44
MQKAKGKVPVSYWVVTVIGLIWNSFGGFDYTMTRMRNVNYLKNAGDPYLLLAWVDSFPLWAQMAWAMGVWGAIAGSLLMLVRSRHAASAFLVSIIGAAASFGYQSYNLPDEMSSATNRGIAFMILLSILFLWQFCRHEIGKGILR